MNRDIPQAGGGPEGGAGVGRSPEGAADGGGQRERPRSQEADGGGQRERPRSQEADGGGQRGRPRSQEADRAIMAATVQLLAEKGLAGMSIEEVAKRAEVGKATIYRRWSSKGLLALDAFVEAFRQQQPLPDTGTLRGDLIAALRAWVQAVTGTSTGRLLTGLIAEAQHDTELRAAWRDRVLEPLRSQHRIMLDRAIARGEIPASVDREVVLDLFFGAAQHRLLLGHLPLTDDFILSVVDIILDGIQRNARNLRSPWCRVSGLCCRSGSPPRAGAVPAGGADGVRLR